MPGGLAHRPETFHQTMHMQLQKEHRQHVCASRSFFTKQRLLRQDAGVSPAAVRLWMIYCCLANNHFQTSPKHLAARSPD